jgi:PAS domain S-box-containing protein
VNDRTTARRRTRKPAVAATPAAGFALFDAELRLAAWNASFAALRGYPRKLLKAGTPLDSFVRFEAERGEYGAGPADASARRRLAALKRTPRTDRELTLPDGRILHLGSERLAGGGLLVTCEDVSDVRRTAQRLSESEERHDFAMRAISEGMYDWDIANDAIHYSERVRDVLGLSAEELGSPTAWRARVHPDDLARYDACHVAHFKGETERFECDYRYRGRDGRWRWARQHGVALRDARGRAYRMIGSTGDITELKERERQLAEHAAEQTAVRELLEAISRSAFDLDAVLRTLIERAARLCRADKGFIFRLEGDAYRLALDYGGVAQAFREFIAEHPIRAGRDTLVGRTALTKSVVHIEDVLADPEYRWPQSQRIGGQRSMLGVPIFRDDVVIGVIALWKERVEPFTLAQIQLVTTFSNQASIAIENARLFNETREALEHQTATAEILKVISNSPEDVKPTFKAILESTTRVCETSIGALFLFDGEMLTCAAHHNTTPEFARVLDQLRVPPSRETPTRLAALERRVVRVDDYLNDPRFTPLPDQLRERGRSQISVPLLREGALVGVISTWRREVRPFTDKHIGLLQAFADQAVIAIENVRLFKETKEALDKQTAISEILRVISASPTDVQPVFDTIVRSAVTLCGSTNGAVFRYDGERLHYVAGHMFTPEWLEAVQSKYPMRPDASAISGRAILTRSLAHIDDVLADPQYDHAHALKGGWRRMLAVPMLRDGAALGVIVVSWAQPGSTPKSQEDLLRTFADQAVIAVENVRLFNELQARNRELTEALEQQTATAGILNVISSSPTDVQPVFEEILRAAARLCDSSLAAIFRFDGKLVHLAASHNWPADALASVASRYPMPPDPAQTSGRVILSGKVVRQDDTLADPGYDQDIAKAGGWRRMLGVPMLREGVSIGAIVVTWREPGITPERQVELLQIFADQAVIAIENVRLFNETKEALEQQTATAEILRVISSSPTDLAPVYDAVAKAVSRLCDAPDVVIVRAEGELLRFAANVGPFGQTFGPDLAIPIDRGSIAGRAMLERRTIQVRDLAAEPEDEYPVGKGLQRRYGHRTMVAAPLLLGDAALGAIAMLRTEVRPFSDRQLALLRTFADQAVIAIQNVRLFNETKEALERQTATSEVLAAISGSMTDPGPVFNRIVQSVRRLFGTRFAVLQLLRDGVVEMPAVDGDAGFERLRERYPRPLDDTTVGGQAMLSKQPIQVSPVIGNPATPSATVEFAREFGFDAVLFAPMINDGRVVGAIGAARLGAKPFGDREVALIKTFADQAVIAIENVRLFNETNEALARQTATAEILRVISGSPTDIQPVLDAVAERAGKLCDAPYANVMLVDGDVLRVMSVYSTEPGPTPDQRNFVPIRRTFVNARAVLDGEVIHIPDVLPIMDSEFPDIRRNQEKFGFRAVLVVPLMREGRAVGTIFLWRREPGPFSEDQVSLLRTFANQAVIAIENVRLFNETKEALDHQKASAEVLQVISSSVADTKPVFSKILESCERLFAGRNVGIALVGENDKVHVIAYHGPGGEDVMRQFPVPLSDASGAGSAILQRRVMHYPDVEAPGVPEYARHGSQRMGIKALLIAPMLWEGRGIGVIFVGRATVGEFSEKEIALLKTFADQAVIAIQNARLFREIEEKSHQLEIANQHKSAFLANMSHELRTPLNAVIGFSEMLAARYFGDLTEKQAEYVTDIHASGKHLLSLINDILDLSKIEAGRMELETAEFDLRAALDNALTLVRERAQRGGIALTLEADSDLGALEGDERKLKQVVLNLLSNAVKFTPRGGAVRVAARRTNGAAEIAVSDTGVGIAPQDQEAIFEAFRQVGTDATRKREGTGLGLALTRRFVELHGGTIRVESAVGKGSTFTVTLPIRHGE